MAKIPIEHSIVIVEEIIANGCGRFTADEVEAFESIIQGLKKSDGTSSQKKEEVSRFVIQFLRSFMYHELFKELEHFLRS